MVANPLEKISETNSNITELGAEEIDNSVWSSLEHNVAVLVTTTL